MMPSEILSLGATAPSLPNARLGMIQGTVRAAVEAMEVRTNSRRDAFELLDMSTFLCKKKEKLSLIGLGYVGLPIALEFAKKISVIGFDINESRIKLRRKIPMTGRPAHRWR